MKVLFFGTYDASRCPRVAVWKQGLVLCGDEVTEINVPLGLDTAARVRILRRPWMLPLLAAKLARAWFRLWRLSRGVAKPDAVAIGYMAHFDVHLARLIWREVPLVLDHLVSAADTAADRGARSAIVHRLLRLLDRRALAASDLCCVDTQEHLELIPAEYRERTLVVQVGVVEEGFRNPYRRGPGPLRVLFFGSFTPLQGTPVIGRAIASLTTAPAADIQFTMVGTGQDYARTRAAAGSAEAVEWLEWVPPYELPGILSSHDVCLGIFGTGPKALRVVPNKVFQGAATGCAIVTSDTPPQRRALGDAAVYVAPGDSGALAETLGDLARNPETVWDLRRAAYERARADFSPYSTVQPLRNALVRRSS